MAIKLIGVKWTLGSESIKEFMLDTESDVKDLPESTPGSMALTPSGKVYIVNASGRWVEFGIE